MTTYDKPKRKNQPLPVNNIFSMLASFLRGLGYYSLVVPLRWLWQQTRRVLSWSWSLTKWIIGDIWRQSGNMLSWTWRMTATILQKTVLAPFIMLGRLLGFVPNAIPAGLSSVEAEVYQRVGRQYRRRKRWYLHILIFLMSMTTLWVSELYGTYFYPPRTGAIIAITICWLLVLGGHRLWMNLGKSEDQEIGEELNRIRNTEAKSNHDTYYDTSHLEDHHHYDDETWADEQDYFQSQYNQD